MVDGRGEVARSEARRPEIAFHGVHLGEPVLQKAREQSDAAVQVQRAVPGQVAEGGYGLGLILQTMDEVSYQREAGHNTLQMSLRLEPDATAGATAVASGPDLAAGADLGDPAAATNTEDPSERRGR